MVLSLFQAALGSAARPSADEAALIPPWYIPMGWLPEEQCGRAWGMRATGDPRQPRLLVVSVGGVGTTTMMEELDTIPELSPQLNSKYDRDGLKHAPYSRLAEHSCHLSRVERILYLWSSSPGKSAESLYRRHYQFFQAVKTRTNPFPAGAAGGKGSFYQGGEKGKLTLVDTCRLAPRCQSGDASPYDVFSPPGAVGSS